MVANSRVRLKIIIYILNTSANDFSSDTMGPKMTLDTHYVVNVKRYRDLP